MPSTCTKVFERPFYPPATLTHGIFVNGQGQRFINEDAYHGRIGCYLVKQTFPVYLVLNVDDYSDYETASWLAAPVKGTGETIDELADELDLPIGSSRRPCHGITRQLKPALI